MKRLLYIMLLLAGLFGSASAQQDPQFTMSMFNRQVMNPGFVGAPGALQLTFASRTQWVGIDGHPTTFTLGVNAPVRILRGGLGLHLVNDAIGPFTSTGIKLSYAFHIPIGSNGASLNLGISPGIFLRQLDATNFRAFEASDPTLQGIFAQRINQNNFDLGAGVYFHMPSRTARNDVDKIYLGLSLDNLLEPRLENWTQTTNRDTMSKIYRHLMFQGGYRFGNGSVCFVPNVFFKWALGTPQMQAELVGNLHVKPMVFGIGYRGLRNVSELMAVMGFHANQKLFIAYSYDYTISGLSVATSGSHEVVVQYTFPKVTRFYPPNLDVKQNPVIR